MSHEADRFTASMTFVAAQRFPAERAHYRVTVVVDDAVQPEVRLFGVSREIAARHFDAVVVDLERRAAWNTLPVPA